MALFGWESVGRNDPYYQACLAGSTVGGTAIGTSMGSLTLPGLGTVAGWAAGGGIGFVAGYLACPYLAPRIRDKVQGGLPLSLAELRSAAEAMGKFASIGRAQDAIKLVAFASASPRNFAPICADPKMVAQKLLRLG